MKLTGNFVLRTIAGEHVLMPQGAALLDGVKPLIVNEVTADLLIAAAEGKAWETIIEWFASEYDAEADVVRQELEKTADKLADSGVLTREA